MSGSASPKRIGAYDVIGKLASGGMATAYISRKTGEAGFERLVVLKRVHPHLLEDPSLRDGLRDEARLAASIHHPNVVPVEDVVEAAGELCLVMPYVESLSLGELVARASEAGKPRGIPAAIASRILLDVLAGLEAAHEAKDLRGEPLAIVHRDVSPRNVLVGSDGEARLIDFGVAKAEGRVTRTASGIMKGTLAYMAPEQLRRREIDRRADVFAAGAVLFEALTGERLFDGKDEADVLIGVLADEIPALSGRVLGATAALDEALAGALARDLDERFPTAQAFAEALERALPPAPAREVASLVERLGAAELEARRASIRVFLDRTATATPLPKAPWWRRRALVASAASLAGMGAIVLATRPGPRFVPTNATEPPGLAAPPQTAPTGQPDPSAAALRGEDAPLVVAAPTGSGHSPIVKPPSQPQNKKIRLGPKEAAPPPDELQANPYR